MRRREVARFVQSRRLGFELLEERQMLAATLEVVSAANGPSVSADGDSGNYSVLVSENGRYVFFDSYAPNVIASAASYPANALNLYRHDRMTGDTILVSVDVTGSGYANRYSTLVDVSQDGNIVLFRSSATNLHALDTTNDEDIYARDIASGTTTLVNSNAAGTIKVTAFVDSNSLSADGRLVVFNSSSNELHPFDQNSLGDVFVRNLVTGEIDLVSQNWSNTGPGNANSGGPRISGDGRVVVFRSGATNLHPLVHEPRSSGEMYARNLETGVLHLVSINVAGTGGVDGAYSWMSINIDGTMVAFASSADGLSEADQNNETNLFLRNLVSDTTTFVSPVGFLFADPMMSANGKIIAYHGTGGLRTYNMETQTQTLIGQFQPQDMSVSADGSTIAFATFDTRVYVHTLATGQTHEIGSTALSGSQDSNPFIAQAANGGIVTFAGRKAFVPGDTNVKLDVFTFDVNSGEFHLISKRLSSVWSSTAAGRSHTLPSTVSANGRYVVFTSDATNLKVDVPVVPNMRNIYRYDRVTGEVELVSVNSTGDGSGNGDSGYAAISADGNMIAFVSDADNLHPLDTGGTDVFVRNMITGETGLVSINATGDGSGDNRAEDAVQISADGKRVMFFSRARNLQPLETYRRTQVFVRDLETQTTTLVTINSLGNGVMDGYASNAVLSGDGNMVVFTSDSTNLHPLDTTTGGDLYARNIATGVTHLVSTNRSGTAGTNDYAGSVAISFDGNIVAFTSRATDLHPLKTSSPLFPYGVEDAFARNLTTGEISLLSVNAAGNGGANDHIYNLTIDAAGRTVAFSTVANNLVNADTDNISDVFARDLARGVTQLVSDNTPSPERPLWSGNYRPVISSDGNVVAFVSSDGISDVFARNLISGQTVTLSRTLEGPYGVDDNTQLSISSDGSVVAFTSEARDLVEADLNDDIDVFVAHVTYDLARLLGDYNLDGAVDAADYSVWRDAVGRTGLAAFSGADGDGDGDVYQDDYGVWKVNFGRVMGGGGGTVTGRDGGGTQLRVESTFPPAEPGAGGRTAVVGLRVGSGSQPPALPGVLWRDERITRGDAVKESGRDVLRRHPREHSKTVADRALVAWVAEQWADRRGATDFLKAQVLESAVDTDRVDRAGLLESLELAELAGV